MVQTILKSEPTSLEFVNLNLLVNSEVLNKSYNCGKSSYTRKSSALHVIVRCQLLTKVVGKLLTQQLLTFCNIFTLVIRTTLLVYGSQNAADTHHSNF